MAGDRHVGGAVKLEVAAVVFRGVGQLYGQRELARGGSVAANVDVPAEILPRTVASELHRLDKPEQFELVRGVDLREQHGEAVIQPLRVRVRRDPGDVADAIVARGQVAARIDRAGSLAARLAKHDDLRTFRRRECRRQQLRERSRAIGVDRMNLPVRIAPVPVERE